MSILNIHLNTDIVTGDLTIDFHPREECTIPVSIEEWPSVRSQLREEVEKEIENPKEWVSHLDSDRTGERLDVKIGTAVVDGNGNIETIDVYRTSPEDVDW